MNLKAYIAEAAGTFGLVFVGVGAIVLNDTHGWLGGAGVALAFGAVVTAMIFAFGAASGAHINPAVSIGFFLSGSLKGRDLAGYVAAQAVGAVAAALIVKAMAATHPTLGATAATVGLPAAFAIEVAITAVLMFVIFAASSKADAPGWVTPVAVGATVGLFALTCGPLTGASMNPARSLGPALAAGQLGELWLYLTAPVLGAMLAVPACRCMKPCNCACRPPLAA